MDNLEIYKIYCCISLIADRHKKYISNDEQKTS